MHEVYPKPVKYKLYRKNKLIRTYASLEAFLTAHTAHWVLGNLANELPVKTWDWVSGWVWVTGYHWYHLTDREDNVVPRDYVMTFLPKPGNYRTNSLLLAGKIRVRSPRKLKVGTELRAIDDWQDSFKIRSKRAHKLKYACGWRTYSQDRSWKKYRKHQWKDE